MAKLVECVPNFSEGRDLEKIRRIVAPFLSTEGVELLGTAPDRDHNRVVVTVLGEPEAVGRSVVEAIGTATREIDMNSQQGEHPRLGSTDVVPFIPIRDMTMEEAVILSKRVAAEVAERYGLPVYLYEKAAAWPDRENLAMIRKGEYEGLKEKMTQSAWKPDFGPDTPHPTAGAVVIGARMPLIAFNINLDSNDLALATRIAKCIRHSSGGFRYCKAMGVNLAEKGIVQVSINMTDYTKTPLHTVFEAVRLEAERNGVSIAGSEIIGLAPMEALVDAASYFLRLGGFTSQQVIESHLLRATYLFQAEEKHTPL